MGKDKRPSPEEMLVAAATDIHNDNCTLMARLADPDFDPATGLDCTLNGALEHIMALYERLLLFPQGFVPYEKVDFMVESTNALISAVERRYRLASAHKAGQAFRESLRWWHTTNEFHAMPHEAYKKHMIDSREGFIAALREFNYELFKSTIPQPAPSNPPPANQPIKVELTKDSADLIAKAVRPGKGGARRMFNEAIQEKCWHYWETGRRNPAVAESLRESGRKVTHADVFAYYRRELGALDPPIDSPKAFESALRARRNRINRKTSH